MRTSTNYNLKLPEGTDNVRRKDFVDNFEIIDREMKNNDTSMKDIAKKQEELKETVANIDLDAEKVNLSGVTGITSKNVKGAIQELFTNASNGKSYIAGKVGNVTDNNTFTQIGDRVQIDKNDFAIQLKAKNVDANGNETLTSLVGKIANISVSGMGGIFYSQFSTELQAKQSKTFTLSFTPSIILGKFFHITSTNRFPGVLLYSVNKYGIANTDFSAREDKSGNTLNFTISGNTLKIENSSTTDMELNFIAIN